MHIRAKEVVIAYPITHALRAGCRLGTKVSLRVPFGFGAHRRARELVVQVRRERPAAADMRGEAVGSFEVSKDAISSRVACVQGGPRTVTPTGGATPAASPQRSREGHRGERAPQVLRTLRCGSQQGNEKAGSRRLTLGEPLGFAGPPAAAVACAPAAGLRRKSLLFQVFPEPLASSLGKPKISAPYSPPSGRLRLSPAAACGTLRSQARFASVTSFALLDTPFSPLARCPKRPVLRTLRVTARHVTG